jgi:hypothetical protein
MTRDHCSLEMPEKAGFEGVVEIGRTALVLATGLLVHGNKATTEDQ